MKYFVTVNGIEHVVEVEERLGKLTVAVDGEELDFSYAEVDRLGQVAVLQDGRSYGASIEGDESSCAVTVAGHLYEVELEDERQRAAHAAERGRPESAGNVDSVMPGVVSKLLVEEGQEVAEGEPLLILEAMKMQNEIPAPCSGRVKRVHVAEGRAVASGERLITIEL